VQVPEMLTQRGFISWRDIGMALVVVILFLAVLAMVANP
jgi:hypothetical protein